VNAYPRNMQYLKELHAFAVFALKAKMHRNSRAGFLQGALM